MACNYVNMEDMTLSAEIIGLGVMIIVGLFLYGVISGFQRHRSHRKNDQQAEQTAKLLNAVAYEEWEKKRAAETGKPLKKSKKATDFKQTRN